MSRMPDKSSTTDLFEAKLLKEGDLDVACINRLREESITVAENTLQKYKELLELGHIKGNPSAYLMRMLRNQSSQVPTPSFLFDAVPSWLSYYSFSPPSVPSVVTSRVGSISRAEVAGSDGLTTGDPSPGRGLHDPTIPTGVLHPSCTPLSRLCLFFHGHLRAINKGGCV